MMITSPICVTRAIFPVRLAFNLQRQCYKQVESTVWRIMESDQKLLRDITILVVGWKRMQSKSF